ncbi:MAG: winged helix-turn-helix domain-containing protein [Solirubrobacterales bacterium]
MSKESERSREQRVKTGIANGHRVRVAILQQFEDDAVEELSASEAAALVGESLAVTSYHFRVLAGIEAIEQTRQEPIRGSVKTFYKLSEAG